MSLFALPVTVSDLTNLQQGIEFFTNTAEATAQAAVINTPGTSSSVFIYATQLLANNISLSQVAMADTAIMEGGTVAVGNTTTSNTLTFLSTQFLPNQVTVAIANNFNPTVYAAEALGLALASTTGFTTNFAGLNTTAFVSAVATATGVNAGAIQVFVTNWTNFYSGVGSNAHPGLTVQQAAYGAAFGDAIGVALLNPTSANLQTIVSTQTPQSPTQFSPNTVKGLVANALINIAEDNANGTPGALYKTGVALGALQAHTPLQGEFTAIPTTSVFLTTGVDNATQGFSTSPTGTPLLNGFTATANNTTFNGIVSSALGGVGSTWTPGDQVTAKAGTTGVAFNLQGAGGAGVINVTAVGPGQNTVSGVQTANIASTVLAGGASDQAVIGDFTAAGPEKDWVGLTALNVTSAGGAAGNGANVDTLTADPTTAVNVQDTLKGATTAAMTVNGGSIVTITEDNNTKVNGGITVNGGTGTTIVSVTQNHTTGTDGTVKIVDAGFAGKAAGTITTVTLDGLQGGANAIDDNALATLTVNNSDALAATALAIVDNLTPATATTLALTVSNDGINPPAGPNHALTITDTNNTYATVHLTVASTSFVDFTGNALITLDTPAGSGGALVGANSTSNAAAPGALSTFTDTVAAAVSFDFTGLNGANAIESSRGATLDADVYKLGNFGTDIGGVFNASTGVTTSQHFTIANTNPLNTATIDFGSGAYSITDAVHTTNPYNYVETAANGAGLIAGNADNLIAGTAAQWARISGIHVGATGDTLLFQSTPSSQPTVNLGPQGTVGVGIVVALTLTPAGTASTFDVGGNTYVFNHADASATLTAADSMVEVTGIHTLSNPAVGGLLHFVT
jgi:hypothetical protein